MSDLISCSALGIGKAKREVFENPAYADGWNSVIEIVMNAPKVDAVPVVRCKDCKRYGVYEASGNGYCKHINGLLYPEPCDFCSYGERKDNDGNPN